MDCLSDGGPARLYFVISIMLRDVSHEVTVYACNSIDDTSGQGVMLSNETLAAL